MASAKDVTVIIPCSNEHLPLLERAIQSTSNAGACIVIGDAVDYFTRANHETARQGIVQFNHSSTYDIPTGVCVARNYGISLSQTPLILPLDADDYLLPGAVERMAEAWSPGKVVYGSWVENESSIEIKPWQGEPIGSYIWKAHEYRQAPPPEMLSRKHVCHATYLFAKEDWQRVGGYDPDFSIGAEDWAFIIALVNAGCELIRLDDAPLYVKTVNENGRTHKAIRHKDMIRQLLLEKYPAYMTRF